MVALRAFAAAAFAALAAATLGVDVSQPVSTSSAKCLVSSGYTFAVVRAWKSYGAFDTNGEYPRMREPPPLPSRPLPPRAVCCCR